MVKRLIRVILIVVPALILLRAVTLYFGQNSLIYHPQRYITRPAVPDGLLVKDLELGGGAGKAFLVTKKAVQDITPTQLWVLFNGNAGTALGWLDVIKNWSLTGKVFLLVDYPGYGDMPGTPGREAIAISSATLFAKAQQELGSGVSYEGVIGYSLGSAAALEFAARFRPKKVLLFAPFTSLLDMACHQVGRPFCYLLIDRFDNVERLKDLALAEMPRTLIIHGDHDEIIPVEMSRALSRQNVHIRYLEVSGATHSSVIHSEARTVNEFLAE